MENFNFADMENIDPRSISLQPFLANLQGNILKGHGRDHTTHIFIKFENGCLEDVRKWLSCFSEEHVTSFQQQLRERELYNRNKVSGSLFASVLITKKGYDYLELTDKVQDVKNTAFKEGMKKRLEINSDPTVDRWEKGFHNDIHAMILLADDDLSRMGLFAKDVLTCLEKFSLICSVEYGNVIRNANGDGLEHFGYVDGVSQPLFLKDEVDTYMKFHNTTPGKALFNPTASTKLVLTKDPYTTDDQSFGSYFVFRKLEQNVKGFKEAEENLGLGELGGAYLVGRFEDGTPVVLSDEEGIVGSAQLNNFNYKEDSSGGRCPYFAHIRKTNPRENTSPRSKSDFENHIMARRGIPFGHREVNTVLNPSPLQTPEGGVGLLFMSYQASIEEQFEFIQKKWANNADFPKNETGIDPIIGQFTGQNPDKYCNRFYNFPLNYGSPEPAKNANFEQFVTMKGGEYFFAPSMNFLKNIDKHKDVKL